MRRRAFCALLGSVAISPLSALAQTNKLPIIGFLSPNTRSAASPWTAAFVRRLRDLGWVEDRTVTIVYRWEDGRSERAAEFVAELIRLKVDAIVTHGVPNIVAAKQATSTIPIVFAIATDPISSGFIASLARPGGNVTGLTLQALDLGGKRLELLREAIPSLRRLAIIGDPGAALEMAEVEAAARTFGLDVVTSKVWRAEDIAPAFEALKGRVDALYVCAVPLVNSNRVRINALALAAGLPTVHGFREAVEAGALMSYGPNFPDLFRRTADYVDKILHGAKAGDLPVEQPTKFDLVLNLKTAKALGLDILPALLARAEEVIE